MQGWLWSKRESEELFAALSDRAALQQRFLAICAQTQKNSLPKADCDSEKKDLIFQRYTELFGTYGDEKLFLDNIDLLIGMQKTSAALTGIAPLFLYRISAYMNRHAAELTAAFLGADAEGVKALCGEILTGSALTAREQPTDLPTVALFLASIDGGLMELVDYYANDLLIHAAERLTYSAPAEEVR